MFKSKSNKITYCLTTSLLLVIATALAAADRFPNQNHLDNLTSLSNAPSPLPEPGNSYKIFHQDNNVKDFTNGVYNSTIDTNGNIWIVTKDGSGVADGLYFNGTVVTGITYSEQTFNIWFVKAIGSTVYLIGKGATDNSVKMFSWNKNGDPDIAKNIVYEKDVTADDISQIGFTYVEGNSFIVYGKGTSEWSIYVATGAVKSSRFIKQTLKDTTGGAAITFTDNDLKIDVNHNEPTGGYPEYFVLTTSKTYDIHPKDTTENAATEIKLDSASVGGLITSIDLWLNKNQNEISYFFASDKIYKLTRESSAKEFLTIIPSNIPVVTASNPFTSAYAREVDDSIFVTTKNALYYLGSDQDYGELIFSVVQNFDPAIPTGSAFGNLEKSGNGLIWFTTLIDNKMNFYLEFNPPAEGVSLLVVLLSSIFGTAGVVGIALIVWYFYLRTKKNKRIVNTIVAQNEISKEKPTSTNKKSSKKAKPKNDQAQEKKK